MMLSLPQILHILELHVLLQSKTPPHQSLILVPHTIYEYQGVVISINYNIIHGASKYTLKCCKASNKAKVSFLHVK